MHFLRPAVPANRLPDQPWASRLRKRPQAGFTVIEAMITLLVAGIGFLAIARLQTITANNAMITAQGNEALHLAQDKLNYFRSDGHYSLIAANPTGETITGVNAAYLRTWSVTECAISSVGVTTCTGVLDATVAHYKQVTVKVNWTDVTGTNRFVLLASNFSSVESSPSKGFFSEWVPGSGDGWNDVWHDGARAAPVLIARNEVTHD